MWKRVNIFFFFLFFFFFWVDMEWGKGEVGESCVLIYISCNLKN
jgi:hypothetical protein